MAFLYGLLRGLATLLRVAASFRLSRAKTRYERADQSFRDQESNCKALEVEVGRPAGFGEQLKLLKLYENSEAARSQWMKARRRYDRRLTSEQWLKDLSGRKLPYTFGLLDMATIAYAVDRIGGGARLWTSFWNQMSQLF